jgi:hypothetical protein
MKKKYSDIKTKLRTRFSILFTNKMGYSISTTNNPKFKFIDLFAGIGGYQA